MLKPRGWWILQALASVVGFAAPLCAQMTVGVGPLLGYYRPHGHFDPASIYSTALPREPSDLRGRAWGGAAHISFGQRLGTEGRVSITNSTIPGMFTPAGPVGPTAAQVLVATVQGQYDISLFPERYHLWLSAGPGFIRHGGDAYGQYGSPVSVGSALGVDLTVSIPVGLEIAAGATAVRYTFDLAMPPALRGNPGSLQHGDRMDRLIHLGIRWGRR